MTAHVEHFTLKALAAAPQSFSLALTPTCSFNTVVTGDARSIAAVAIVNGSMPMWAATLMQTSPTATTPLDLKIGSEVVKAGTTLTLTIPTSTQMGMVVASTTIVSPNNPAGISFEASIAQWSLVSTM